MPRLAAHDEMGRFPVKIEMARDEFGAGQRVAIEEKEDVARGLRCAGIGRG